MPSVLAEQGCDAAWMGACWSSQPCKHIQSRQFIIIIITTEKQAGKTPQEGDLPLRQQAEKGLASFVCSAACLWRRRQGWKNCCALWGGSLGERQLEKFPLDGQGPAFDPLDLLLVWQRWRDGFCLSRTASCSVVLDHRAALGARRVLVKMGLCSSALASSINQLVMGNFCCSRLYITKYSYFNTEAFFPIALC